MPKFRVLVVDDSISSNRKIIARLFDEDTDFAPVIAETEAEFCSARICDFDAILLDVNLENWGMTLLQAFAIIKNLCPIYLMSQRWIEPDTHRNISDAMSASKEVQVIGSLALNDLSTVKGWKERAMSIRTNLRMGIARVTQRGRIDLKDDDPIRILHLSDPQYGDPGEDHMAFLSEAEIPHYVLDTLGRTIQFLAITGDITYSGQPTEFETAACKIESLAKSLFPTKSSWAERILMVPGNHDVDLRVCSADQIRFDFKSKRPKIYRRSKDESHRRLGLQAFRDFAWKLSGNRNWRDANELLWVNESFRHLGVRFYMINTVAMIDSRNPARYEIPVDTLEEIADIRANDPDMCGIAICHHGPPIVIDGVVTAPEESIANWDRVCKALQQSPIRVLLHGHGHDRTSDLVSVDNVCGVRVAKGQLNKNEILRVMAPTSHLAEKLRTNGSTRGFSIICLNRTYGRVRSVEVSHYELHDGKPRPAHNRGVDVIL